MDMAKILEFQEVYLELPDEYELKDEKKSVQEIDGENKITKMSLEELQRKLEETQSLHL